MCGMYVNFGSKVRPIIFGCVAMGSTVLFILSSRLLVYSTWSGVNRVQDVLSGLRQKLYVDMVVCIYLLHSCLCVYVMVMSSA